MSSPVLSQKQIIIVEDEEIIMDALSQWFSQHNQVMAFPSAEAALAKKPEFSKVDAFIIDYMLPGIDGIKLFKQLRPEFPNAKFILISGKVDLDSAQEAYELGLDALIQKPFDLNILEKNVADLIGV